MTNLELNVFFTLFVHPKSINLVLQLRMQCPMSALNLTTCSCCTDVPLNTRNRIPPKSSLHKPCSKSYVDRYGLMDMYTISTPNGGSRICDSSFSIVSSFQNLT